MPHITHLYDLCDNYIEHCNKHNDFAANEQIYNDCCDYLMSTENSKQVARLKEFFKISD
jgi:hypothetical protein